MAARITAVRSVFTPLGGIRARETRVVATFGVLIAVTVAAVLLSVAVGAVQVSPLQVAGILLDHTGIETGISYSTVQDAVVWNIRLPRVLLGLLVGAGLSVSGAALQGIFRNPLADPGIIGVSSGAALGAIAVILLGIAPLGMATMPSAAFAGGLALTGLVYHFSRHDGRTEVVTLVLTGVALNAIAGAVIGLMSYYADDEQLRGIVFWSLGSLGGATWDAVWVATPFALVGIVLMFRWGRAMNLFVLGEREAFHLGIRVERVRLALITLAALTTGAAVAVAGIVGFVGLVVPHLVRLLIGPDHRTLLPASALGGAALVVLADLVARTLVIPAELPLGVVTSLVGGPYFLWLLHRTRRNQGGWA